MKFDKELFETITFQSDSVIDWPDLTDIYIESAIYNGLPLTDSQLDDLNDDTELVRDLAVDYLF